MTNFFIVCNITLWNDVKRWFIVFFILSSCTCSCAATSFLKEVSIYSLNVVLFFSRIFRKTSWENDETKVKSPFVMEAVVYVVLKSYNCFEYYFSFCCRLWEMMLRFRCRMKLWCDVCIHCVVGWWILLWKIWIVLVKLQHKLLGKN